MARFFEVGEAEYLHVASGVVTSAPWTMFVWMYPLAAWTSAIEIASATQGNAFWRLTFDATAATIRTKVSGSSSSAATTANSVSLNSWQSVAARGTTTLREVVLAGDFGNKGSDATTKTPGSIASTRVGIVDFPIYMNGSIAWPAVWNALLTDAEIQSLNARAYPPKIRPESLVSFWPLGGFDTHEIDGGVARDIWGGLDLMAASDATGPGVADHPGGLIYPTTALPPSPDPVYYQSQLRRSTNNQPVMIGPFLDSSDADTVEDGLTIANTDIKLHKTGATTLVDKNSGGGATYISDGMYSIILDNIDTDTAGSLTIFVHMAGALAVKCTCPVYPKAVYDSKFDDSMIHGTVSGSPSTTSVPASNLPDSLDNDNYLGRIIVFLSGALIGQSINITSYNGSTKIITVPALTSAPSVSDTFIIV